MFDYLEIGPTPAEESCEQLGPGYTQAKAKRECQQFIEAIRKVVGPEPEGARLTVRSNPHDFGTYYEVAVKYDGSSPGATEYALKVESEAPSTWPEGFPNVDLETGTPLGVPETGKTDKPDFRGKAAVYWIGQAPEQCDLCARLLIDTFIDGRTDMGAWAFMCPSCHASHGYGLGIGKGQKYQKQTDGKWQKVSG